MEDNYKANCEINKIKGKFADLQKDLSSSEEKVAKLQLDLSPSQEPFGACFGENEDSPDLFDDFWTSLFARNDSFSLVSAPLSVNM
jgi:hypothetical protein